MSEDLDMNADDRKTRLDKAVVQRIAKIKEDWALAYGRPLLPERTTMYGLPVLTPPTPTSSSDVVSETEMLERIVKRHELNDVDWLALVAVPWLLKENAGLKAQVADLERRIALTKATIGGRS